VPNPAGTAATFSTAGFVDLNKFHFFGTGASLTRFQAFRQPLASANFHIARNVGWHDQDGNGSLDVHAGLTSQASGNITGAQQGTPVTPETIEVSNTNRNVP
jgi:hypothetical protein